MMKTLVLTVTISAILLLNGCAQNEVRNSSNYNAYLDAVKAVQTAKITASQTAAEERNRQLEKSKADCNGNASCVATVASYQALSSVVDSLAAQMGGGNNALNVAAPPREPSTMEKLLPWAGMIVPALGNAYALHENSRVQIHAADSNAAIEIAQTNAWAGVVNGVASRPTTYVGGNYGDTYGNDYTGGTRTDNSGTMVTGNENRLNSPNTGGNGGNCPSGTAGTGGAGGTSAGGVGGNTGAGGNCSGGGVGG